MTIDFDQTEWLRRTNVAWRLLRADNAQSTRFYRDLLGFVVLGGFTGHDGCDGVFFARPGEGNWS